MSTTCVKTFSWVVGTLNTVSISPFGTSSHTVVFLTWIDTLRAVAKFSQNALYRFHIHVGPSIGLCISGGSFHVNSTCFGFITTKGN